MIAGGVGITPFRAMLKEIEKSNKRSVTLIYSARSTHLFAPELNKIAAQDSQVKIIYTKDKTETDAALASIVASAPADTDYFISGVPGMVKDVTNYLKATGVKKNKILTDSFRGY